MSLLNSIIEPFFVTDAHGRTVFFPNGYARHGYLVSAPAKRRIGVWLSVFWVLSAATFVVAVALVHLYGLFSLLVIVVSYYAVLAHLLHKAERVPPLGARPSWAEWLATLGGAIGVVGAIAVVALNLFLVTLFLYVALGTRKPVLGVLGLLCFGVSTSVSVLIMRAAMRSKVRKG